MKKIKRIALASLVVLIILISFSAHAEEGGSGHYMPGGAASFVDAIPGKEGPAIANYFTYYSGKTDRSKQLPYGGSASAGLDATAYVDTILAFYKTPLTLLGGKYTVAAAIPFVWATVSADTKLVGPRGSTIASNNAKDSDGGIGDILIYPFMLGWTALGGDLRYDFRFGIYSPTGHYDKNSLANVGKNYWTFEPAVSVSWLSSKIGLEISAFAGVDFNTQNDDTKYQSGDQFHAELTIAQHLPLFGGLIGLGANAFYYQQISADSGAGATLGDFKGRTSGVGPVLSYVTKVWGEKDLVAEIKWLPEIDVENRLKGDYIWFKVGLSF